MPKPHDPDRYELSDAEKRDLIALIQRGKPLPDKYRFLLFADKREVELVWSGKTREVCNIVLPFQTLEHIDEPRPEPADADELALDTRGRQLKGWTNKLIWGDNKLILASLKSGALRRQIEDAGGLKLIYIDPPFDVGADFSMDIAIGGETFHKEPNLLEQIAYRDTWGRGADSFLAMIYERLLLMRDLLHDEGSIYVHCDWRVTGFIRQALDEVFGKDHFVNELIWKRQSAKSGAFEGIGQFGRIHETIYFYSRGEHFTWNQQFAPYDESYIQDFYKHVEAGTGRRYRLSDLTAAGPRQGDSGGALKIGKSTVRPAAGRHWALGLQPKETVQQAMDRLVAENRIDFREGGMPQYKRYLDEMPGVALQDIWTDVLPVSPQGVERLAYPTQKPEALLERIIRASSNEGDLVADFFCGSGTTAAVAEKLGRKWIATDLGKFAIHTTRKRLIGVQRELKAAGQPFRAFEVLNLGRYERQAYLNVSPRLTGKKKEQALAKKEREFRELILKAYRAEPLSGAGRTGDDGFFHGKLGGRLVVVGPINLPVGRLFVEEVVTECRKRGASRVDVLAFEFEMGLFPAALDEAKQKGIDLAPKTIPPEVFDKRAVEKGQVRFHDVSYIEATPRYDAKHKLRVAVELTDFSVYYTQGLVDAIAAGLKAGKSEVVCENGKLVKLAKDKQGVVTKDILTKQWTDWVDYWAVDFDYQSRKEIIKVPKQMGVEGALPGVVQAGEEFVEFEERWTGAYIFENEWQSFRTRKRRELELLSAAHEYPRPGRYTVAVKVVDIFGNDTMTLVPVTAG
ncbi:MAG: Modification methylase DpnIIB [Verrucomicrobia bacterium ADurb.Bin118]|jgi:site-specific DNA-methyltransferase (adenine-specific)/adenine-specific DNA-methyltransferase|nr:MAG: Modification methylase DpnIIB [Verrucomicrobia bacterium ADurb.Bin118]